MGTKLPDTTWTDCSPTGKGTKITIKDLKKGYKMFLEVGDKDAKNSTKELLHHMYV